ncbi:hypothetical protein BC829DRAFT_389355 [Chytridium lagenaria]|nr:hypothetical protein BC829DRAFT_389355 [Chytridium lagenaria]
MASLEHPLGLDEEKYSDAGVDWTPWGDDSEAVTPLSRFQPTARGYDLHNDSAPSSPPTRCASPSLSDSSASCSFSSFSGSSEGGASRASSQRDALTYITRSDSSQLSIVNGMALVGDGEMRHSRSVSSNGSMMFSQEFATMPHLVTPYGGESRNPSPALSVASSRSMRSTRYGREKVGGILLTASPPLSMPLSPQPLDANVYTQNGRTGRTGSMSASNMYRRRAQGVSLATSPTMVATKNEGGIGGVVR